jgi:nicotinamide mononucleotide transporter
MQTILEQFWQGLLATSLLEAVAVCTGILSVYFSRKLMVWVYPTGLVSTIIYTYLCWKGHLLGEASVNLYYTVMSLYGWYLWSQKNLAQAPVLQVTMDTNKAIVYQLLAFVAIYLLLYGALQFFQQYFAPEAIPWADAAASASAYIGMYLMAKKKIMSWFWWIITNAISIPLYFVKGYVFTSVQFMVLLVLAVLGAQAWYQAVPSTRKKAPLD